MLIDGFTIIAQIINFLILLFLLRRFLYGPIIHIMNERQENIAAQIAEAQHLKQQAVAEAEAHRQQRDELQKQRDEMLFQARAAAEDQRKDLLSKAREEVDEARTNWHKGIEAEKQAFIQEIRREISKQIYGISRRVLIDLADAELEEQVTQVFLRRLYELDDTERETLIEAVNNSQKHAVLRSAFEISASKRQGIRQVLQEVMDAEVPVDFEIKPDLVWGIEMSVQEYKLAWTLDEYLVSLEESISEALARQTERIHDG